MSLEFLLIMCTETTGISEPSLVPWYQDQVVFDVSFDIFLVFLSMSELRSQLERIWCRAFPPNADCI